MKTKLILEHAPNGDIAHDERRGYWSPPIDKAKTVVENVSLPEARKAFREWIKRNGLGIGNMTRRTGQYYLGSRLLGAFEYGGRFFYADGSESQAAQDPAIPAAADEVDAALHLEEGDEDPERPAWPPSAAVLASDRRLARRGLSVFRFSSGAVMTQNSRGRCEDAPCCGCCS